MLNRGQRGCAWGDLSGVKFVCSLNGRANNLRSMVVGEPEILDRFYYFNKFARLVWFCEVSICTELIGGCDVFLIRGCAQDDHNGRDAGLANKLQDVEAVNVWQLQIEQDEIRQWKFGAVGELAVTIKIVDGLLSIPCN